MKNKIVLITGATSGIGWATAITMAKQGAQLILCGRRKERLEALAKEIGGNPQLLSFDVRDKEAVFKAIKTLPSDWKQIDLLINNAGNAHGLDPVQTADLDDWDAMIDSNVKGLMYVTKAVLPTMIKAKKGHIINLGSIAGKEVYPKGNIYCASKFAVDAISQGMRIDLNKFNIKVSQINPGLVETNFSMVRFKDDEDKSKSVYSGVNPLVGVDVAKVISYVINCPENVNISDITVLAKSQASSTVVNRD